MSGYGTQAVRYAVKFSKVTLLIFPHTLDMKNKLIRRMVFYVTVNILSFYQGNQLSSAKETRVPMTQLLATLTNEEIISSNS